MNSNKQKIKVLYHYMRGAAAGGSDTCLYLLVKYLDKSKFEPIVLFRDESILIEDLRKQKINLINFSQSIKTKLYLQLKKNAEVSVKNENPDKSLKNELVKSSRTSSLIKNIKHIIKRFPETIHYAKLLLKNKIDIVHTNHDITSDHPMILAGLLTKKKIICHNRGLYIPMDIDVYLSKRVEKIICMSDFSKSVYVNNGVNGNKCKTIYDGIDTSFYKPSSIENNKFMISCIGRLEIWKGQHILIDAAEKIVKEIPDIEILLIGAGDFESELKRRVNNKGLEKNILFTGHITNVKDYIEKSSLIVHTSIVPEPFGMVIIEAMALEKVVIATNFGGPVEIIENGVDGILVPPENPEVLADEIVKLSKNTDLRNTLSKQARIKVLEKFDVVQYAKKIENVYQQYLQK